MGTADPAEPRPAALPFLGRSHVVTLEPPAPVEKPKRTPRVDQRGIWVLTVDQLIEIHQGRDQRQPKV